MANKFTEVMASNSDSDLLEIVTKLREDYDPEAVEAAELEIKNRGLTPEQIQTAEKEIEEKEASKIEKENEPLGVAQKILFFIFFWGIIPWLMASTFKANGYLRKHREAWKSIKYGLISWVVVIGVIILIFYIQFKMW